MNQLKVHLMETAVKNFESSRNVLKVLDYSEEPASNKGDNFTSDVVRAKFQVILGSGRVAKKSVIIKRLPEGKETLKWLQQFGLFKREIEVMSVILGGMERLMEQFDEGSEIFWPQLIQHTPYSELIIQDLKVSGYESAARQAGCSLGQATLVMEHIARFHAMSVVMKERGLLDTSGHGTCVILHCPIMIKNYCQASVRTVANIIINSWDSEWREIGSSLLETVDSIPEYLKTLGEPDPTRFNVLNHGDLWTPNILYKTIQGQSDPVSMRLIDFQMTYYTSYVFDLNHFLYSSVSYEVRKNHFEHLLRIYQERLGESLSKYGYEGGTAPSYQDVLDEMERTNFFGLIVSCMIMPVLLSEPDDAVDFESLITAKEEEKHPDMDEKIMSSEIYVKNIKECLLKFYNKRVF